METGSLCERCARKCKQPQAVQLVSCPQFMRIRRNLELFDSQGNISKELAGKRKVARGRPE